MVLMPLRPVVVLALAVLVPVLCLDMTKRCGLRDQLRASLYPRRVWEGSLATVICEVEKFVNRSMMNPPMIPPPSGPYNSSNTAPNSSAAFNASAPPAPPAPGSESPAPGSESPAPGSESPAPGSESPAPGSEFPAPGSEFEEDSREEGRERDGVGKYLRRCVVVTNGTDVKVDRACLTMQKVFVKIYLNAGEDCKMVDPMRFFRDCPKPGPAKPNSGSDESQERPKPKPKPGPGPKPGKKPRQ